MACVVGHGLDVSKPTEAARSWLRELASNVKAIQGEEEPIACFVDTNARVG